MTNEELVELETTKAQLRAAQAELEALKQSPDQPAGEDDLKRYAQMIVLFAIMGLVAWQTYLTIQLRGLLS
jgi:hypothetical protein